MRTGRLISATAATVALVAGVAGCSSSASKSPGQAAAPSATATSTPAAGSTTTAATATTGTAASPTTASAPGGQTIAALLSAFGPGPITGAHQPTADPAWVARVQQNKTPAPQASDPKVLNLMALVDEAAREKDTGSLARLCSDVCNPKIQAPLWQKPDSLQGLTLLIEKGPLWGEGAAIPDFLAFKTNTSFTNAPDAAFGKAAGVDSPAAYFKKFPYWTAFQNGSGGSNLQVEWAGINAAAS